MHEPTSSEISKGTFYTRDIPDDPATLSFIRQNGDEVSVVTQFSTEELDYLKTAHDVITQEAIVKATSQISMFRQAATLPWGGILQDRHYTLSRLQKAANALPGAIRFAKMRKLADLETAFSTVYNAIAPFLPPDTPSRHER